MDEPLKAMLASAFEEMTPNIDASVLPEAERSNIETINLLRQFLTSFINEFEQALALFDFVQSGKNDSSWQWVFIAAKQGLISIWQFGETLAVMERAFGHSPQLRKLLGRKAFRPIIGEFGAYFQHVGEVRNTDAHHVDRIATPELRRINSVNGMILIANIRGRRLCYSRDGREYGVDISHESLRKLKEINSMVLRIFRTADQKLQSLRDLVPPEDTSPQAGA